MTHRSDEQGSSPRAIAWETVEVFGVRGMAEVAGSALRSADIPFRIRADDGGGAFQLPFSLRTRGVELQVPSEEADQARSLLGGDDVEFDAADMAVMGAYDEEPAWAPGGAVAAGRRPHLIALGRVLLAGAVVAVVVEVLRTLA